MPLKREDWEEVVNKCLKEYKVIETALKGMTLAAELQGVMFNKAIEKVKEFPQEAKKPPVGVN